MDETSPERPRAKEQEAEMKCTHEQANGDQARPLTGRRPAQKRCKQRQQNDEAQNHEKERSEVLHAVCAGREIAGPGEADQQYQAPDHEQACDSVSWFHSMTGKWGRCVPWGIFV